MFLHATQLIQVFISHFYDKSNYNVFPSYWDPFLQSLACDIYPAEQKIAGITLL